MVIPARDEETTVGSVVHRAKRNGFDVLVVDDASSDCTAAKAREAGAVVLSYPFNVGAWIAAQTGIRYAAERDYASVVTLDADGQHDPEHIPELLEAFQHATSPNVVIASFPARGSRLRRSAWRLLRTAGLLQVDDLTSGFRCYDRDAVTVLASAQATLLEFQDVGVLLLLLQNGLVIEEIPIAMEPRTAGKSRIFRSWGSVFYYMTYSFMLSISKAVKVRSTSGEVDTER